MKTFHNWDLLKQHLTSGPSSRSLEANFWQRLEEVEYFTRTTFGGYIQDFAREHGIRYNHLPAPSPLTDVDTNVVQYIDPSVFLPPPPPQLAPLPFLPQPQADEDGWRELRAEEFEDDEPREEGSEDDGPREEESACDDCREDAEYHDERSEKNANENVPPSLLGHSVRDNQTPSAFPYSGRPRRSCAAKGLRKTRAVLASDREVEKSEDDEECPSPRPIKKRKLRSRKSSPASIPTSPATTAASPAPSTTSSTSTKGRALPLKVARVVPNCTKRCGVRGCDYTYDPTKTTDGRAHFLGHFGFKLANGKWSKAVAQPCNPETPPLPESSSSSPPSVVGQKRKRGGHERTKPQVLCKWEGCGEVISDTDSGISRHLYSDHLEIRYRCLQGCPPNKLFTRATNAKDHECHGYTAATEQEVADDADVDERTEPESEEEEEEEEEEAYDDEARPFG